MRYCFDRFTLDTARRELRRSALPVPVEPQVFDLIAFLLRHRDRVVDKDSLLDSIWHGRVVSDSALSTRIHAARAALGDTGAEQRLIRTFPRKGLRFVGAVREETEAHPAPSHGGVASNARDEPSIAVMAFANLGDDPAQEYFCDGIVEDITTALSRNRALRVIARSSSFTFKGTNRAAPLVASELGVRYVLEGSVRRSSGRIRVNAQLIEGASGLHLWADRFDGSAADVFALQDRIVTRVIGAVAPRLERAEIARARHATTADLDAYELYLRGLDHWNRWTQADHALALDFFRAAMTKDPDFSTACGLAISCHLLGKANGWIGQSDDAAISRLVEQAADIGNDDPVALCWAGHARAFFFDDVDRALLLVDRALEIDANLAAAWQRSGWIRGYAGDPEGAISSLLRAMRLNPLDPREFLSHSALAFAHFLAGRDGEAAASSATALRLKPNWMPALRVSILANAMRGRPDLAARGRDAYLELDPEASISRICSHYPLRRRSDRQRLVDALHMAGMPG